MVELSLEEIKMIELSLLTEFDRLCKENGLYYTLCGGTLLGAVRHKGFIPWDDDVDVLMPRPDYDRLLNNININLGDLPSYMKIVSWKNGLSNYPFIKLVDERTKVDVEHFNSYLNGVHLWLDIFPMDGNPVKRRDLCKIYRKMKFLRKILAIKLSEGKRAKTSVKRLVKPVLIKCLRVIRFRRLCNIMDDLAKSYDFESLEYIGGTLWGYGPQERIKKEGYMRGISVEFEGRKFNAPSNYKEYLTGLYQDYMKLPPKEQRIKHGISVYM